MKYPSLQYVLFASLLIILGCSPKEIPMSQEFHNNFRSSKIDARGLNLKLSHLFEYRVYSHRSLGTSFNDSIIRNGILLPGVQISQSTSEIEFSFGQGKDTCTVQYISHDKWRHYGRSATLSLLNFFSKSENRVTQTTSDHYLSDTVTGTVRFHGFNNVSFTITNIKTGNSISGSLVLDSIRYILEPFYSKNGRLIGLLFTSGYTEYAAIRKGFYDRVYLYTRATAAEQMIMAAFFVIIEQNW